MHDINIANLKAAHAGLTSYNNLCKFICMYICVFLQEWIRVNPNPLLTFLT